MPYKLKKVHEKYKVVTKGTGKTHSKKALPRSRAVAQMKALYANVPEARATKRRDTPKEDLK